MPSSSMERRDSSPPTIERRTVSATGLRMERRDGSTKQRMIGHASVFNSWTTLYEGRNFLWRELVRPGAYKRAIAEKQDVRCLFNHEPDWLLGRTRSGTLDLSEDGVGLVSDCDPPDTQLVRDLVLSPIERGDLSQMSFTFLPNNRANATVVSEGGVTIIDRGGEKITIRMDDDIEIEERELIDLDLYDVSPVTYPAYTDTDVGLRTRCLRRDQEARERVLPGRVQDVHPHACLRRDQEARERVGRRSAYMRRRLLLAAASFTL